MEQYNQEQETPQEQIPQDAPEDAGRGTDTVMAHMSLGEIVIPRAFQDDPQFMQMLQTAFQNAGVDIAEFTVGDKANKINPETGYPEFGLFFGKGSLFGGHGGVLGNPIFKIGAPLALGALLPGLGTAIGGSLLGAGAAGSATLGNALLGAGLGGATGGLKGAAIGGLLGGVGANLGNSGWVNPDTGLRAAGSGSGILGALGEATGSTLSGLTSLGSLGKALQGPSLSGAPISGSAGGSGILGSIGNATGLTSSSLPSLGGLVGGSGGGGSTFSTGASLASALGGLGQEDAIKKAQKQLLEANAAQQANLGTFDPSSITNDAGYQFNLAEGQKGLDRQNAAAGGLFSGAALKAGSQYNQNYANNALNSAYQRWLDKVGSQNALIGNQGSIRAQGTVAGTNALTSGISGALNPTQGLTSQDLLKLLGKTQTGGLYG